METLASARSNAKVRESPVDSPGGGQAEMDEPNQQTTCCIVGGGPAGIMLGFVAPERSEKSTR